MKVKFLLLFAFALSLTGCRQEPTEVYDPTQAPVVSISQQFSLMWEMLDRGYVFWDVDKTDWDAVYTEYLPKFKALDNRKEIPTEELAALYKEACATLVDHHLHIRIKNYFAPADETGDKTVHITPGDDEVKKRPYYTTISDQDFTAFYNALRAQGRVSDFKDGYFLATNNSRFRITSFVIDGAYSYLHFNGFFLNELASGVCKDGIDFKQPATDAMEALKQWQAQINDKNIKGLILDLRNNGGGDSSDLYRVLGPLTENKFTLGYTHYKQGLGRLDYSEWAPWQVTPNPDIPAQKGLPIACLINANSVSMGEITPTAIKMMPNTKVIGERSYGATGPLISDSNFTYGTPASSKDGSVYAYTSTLCFKDTHGRILEGNGVEPDQTVSYDKDAFLQGNDPQLAAALQFVKK